jgi:two-component system sensor histidine kinase AlgZ
MPNFCKNTSIFIIIITAILLAAMMTLVIEVSQQSINQGFDFNNALIHFSFNSFYLVWLFLLWSACLCMIGRFKPNLSSPFAVCFIVCLFAFVVYEIVIQLSFMGSLNGSRLIQLNIAAIIFLGLSIRGLQISGIYSQRSRLDLQNKLSALQAKIEPHFLFNSLNTIAELTHINPKHAESAIDSLAMILRSNLKDDNLFHSLEEETKLCENYLELEQWRLGNKLSSELNISDTAKSAIVPKLLLQPLIENAVRHGIAPFVHGGKLTTKISTKQKVLLIHIHNTTSEKNAISHEELESKNKGHGIAIENTRERLFVIYDDQYKIKAQQSRNSYDVKIEMPKIPPRQIALPS